MYFDLFNNPTSYLHCDIQADCIHAGRAGVFFGTWDKKLPDNWTLLYKIAIHEVCGKNASLFEFGNHRDNNGFGCYVNSDNYITLRVNNNYDHYKEIDTKLLIGKVYEIVLKHYNNITELVIDKRVVYKINAEINPFDGYGCFNRFWSEYHKDEFVVGSISNVIMADNTLSDTDCDNILSKLSCYLGGCPTCGSCRGNEESIPFLLYPKKDDVQDLSKIQYKICDDCGTVFSTTMMRWTPEDFAKRCYNDKYHYYDGDMNNPHGDRIILMRDYIANNYSKNIKHLDYGAGKCFLKDRLSEVGYKHSYCYDPFKECNDENILKSKYDLITCVEVIEHAYNINEILHNIHNMLNNNGEVLLTTCFYNKESLQDWWYCAPRVGHILFFNKDNIRKIASKHGFSIEAVTPLNWMSIIRLRKS